MNQKKAKQLRKEAQRKTVGMESVKYIIGQPPIFNPNYDAGGMIIDYSKVMYGIPTKLDKNCTRYAYKELKKAA